MRLDGTTLRVEPTEAITLEMHEWLYEHRSQVKAFLAAEQAPAPPSPQPAAQSPPSSAQGYTEVPNLLLDFILPTLGLAERAVLLYICRRLLGFHKEEDAISSTLAPGWSAAMANGSIMARASVTAATCRRRWAR